MIAIYQSLPEMLGDYCSIALDCIVKSQARSKRSPFNLAPATLFRVLELVIETVHACSVNSPEQEHGLEETATREDKGFDALTALRRYGTNWLSAASRQRASVGDDQPLDVPRFRAVFSIWPGR